jgi:hypothetical protein
MKVEQKECFETSAHKIKKPGTHPKERIDHNISWNIRSLECGMCEIIPQKDGERAKKGKEREHGSPQITICSMLAPPLKCGWSDLSKIWSSCDLHKIQ